MGRKLILEYPYSERWTHGYFVTDVDGRCKIVLYNSSEDRTSTLYSRYLLSVKLGRFLESYENVDHIDDNPFNDDPGNLQILTRADNTAKKNHLRGQSWVELSCPVCNTRYTRRKNQSHIVKDKEYDFCSRQCIGRFRSTGAVYDMNPVIFKEYKCDVV